MNEIILQQEETIESLIKLNKLVIELLAQYMSVEEFENQLLKMQEINNK
ncbi:MAG: hypothetical protein K5669_11405 [Lachnospiraceae bacterium]|nr:hypothetical protein [Lachnospiraceae bacterium]